MGCGAAEATVCFCYILMSSANRVDFGLFLFHKFSNFTPPPQVYHGRQSEGNRFITDDSL